MTHAAATFADVLAALESVPLAVEVGEDLLYLRCPRGRTLVVDAAAAGDGEVLVLEERQGEELHVRAAPFVELPAQWRARMAQESTLPAPSRKVLLLVDQAGELVGGLLLRPDPRRLQA